MVRLTSFLAVLAVTILGAGGIGLAAVPVTASETVAFCDPVIKLELTGDQSRRGECVSAVSGFLTARLGLPASGDPNTEIADLVVELAKLYDPAVCKPNDTELSEAITEASAHSTDADQQILVAGIGENIAACADIETGAIDDPLAAPTASP